MLTKKNSPAHNPSFTDMQRLQKLVYMAAIASIVAIVTHWNNSTLNADYKLHYSNTKRFETNTRGPLCGDVGRVFIISLKSRSDRHNISSYLWRKIEESSKCTIPEIRLVEAFDRNILHNHSVVKYLYQNGWKGFKNGSEGAAGAYLSHYQLWLYLNVTYPNETVLVAEDDQDAYTYSMDMLDEVLSRQKLPTDWHVLWLTSSRHDNPDPETRISMNLFKSSAKEKVWGMCVYVLSPAGVRQLLHLHRPAFTSRIGSPIDSENIRFIKQGTLNSYYLLPKLFSHIPRDVVKSSIPESGPVKVVSLKMDIFEPLIAFNKSRDIVKSIESTAFKSLGWEVVNPACWTALFGS